LIFPIILAHNTGTVSPSFLSSFDCFISSSSSSSSYSYCISAGGIGNSGSGNLGSGQPYFFL